MKLLAVVPRHAMPGAGTIAQIDYTGTIPIEGNPPVPSLLELDCPGLDKADRGRLLKWLAKRGTRVGEGTAAPGAEAMALDAIPSTAWRRITLLEAIAFENFTPLAYLAFDAAEPREFTACLDDVVPDLIARIDRALDLEPEHQIDALRDEAKPIQTAASLTWGMSSRLARLAQELADRADNDALAALRRQQGLGVQKWIEHAAKMKSDLGRVIAMTELVSRLPGGEDAPVQAEALLKSASKVSKVRRALEGAPGFWQAIAPLMDLPATVRDEKVGLADAEEVVVTAGWALWEGRRVGRIKVGRKALVVRADSKTTFVRGTRALLKSVIDHGGALRHHGVTLTYPTTTRPLTPMLAEVERIDTLAYVDPDRALALLGPRTPAKGHALFGVLERARTDAGAARMLADMLIELAVGIDADVARKRARGRR